MKYAFYEYAAELDVLKQKSMLSTEDAQQLLTILDGDEELACFFYEKSDTGLMPTPEWLPLLRNAGQFEELGGVADKVTILWRFKAKYIASCASEQPAIVFQILAEIHPFDALVQAYFLDALLKLPIETALRASWIIWDYTGDRGFKIWAWVGTPVAEFMVKSLEVDPDLAFGIARYLLDIWSDEPKSGSLMRDANWRFESPYEYSELIFKYFKQVWKKHPFRAAALLIRTLDNYLEEINKKKNYDASTHLYISMENLDKIDRADRDYETALVRGICEAGRTVIAEDANRISELLRMMRDADKEIFKRIEMYLLRFVPAGVETARIDEIIRDTDRFNSYKGKHEYALLLRDKASHVSDVSKSAFVELIRQTRVTDVGEFAKWFGETRGREYTQEDLEKYENRMRAAKLYLVQSAFPEMYEEYKRKAGAEDAELRPRPMVGPARAVSPTEGSPMTVGEMAKMSAEAVFAYLGEPEGWHVNKAKADHFFEPKEALGSVFKQVVKQRVDDYVAGEQAEHIVQLDSEFAEDYFHGVSDAIRSSEWKKESWIPLLAVANAVVDAHKSDPLYKDAFRAMLSALHDAFGENEKSWAFDTENVEAFWKILEPLVRYNEPPVSDEHERDPMQLRLSSVQGYALSHVVCLAILCKRDHLSLFEERLRQRIRQLLDYVLTDVRRAEVLCAFGIDFARLVWLDEEWVGAKMNAIFADDMWGAVWGTHVSWGRPSREAFDLLYEKGQYKHAVEGIGETGKWDVDKKVEKGLSDHLMIALFNGWLDSDPAGLLTAFLEKAPATLRGHAAYFLTTGFEALKEEPDKEASKRLKQYWERRLASMEKDPQAHKEEACQFLYWAENSPLGGKETLALLERTLNLTNGEMGQKHFPTEFFKGVREMITGNELIALRCLGKVMRDERITSHISLAENAIDAVFQHILALPKDYPGVITVWTEAMQLADTLGRLRVYKFRPVYEELHARMAATEEDRTA